MKIALAQINTKVADIDGNVAKIIAVSNDAAKSNAKIVVFPEMALSGYPIKDLAQNQGFIAQCKAGLKKIIQASKNQNLKDVQILFGMPYLPDNFLSDNFSGKNSKKDNYNKLYFRPFNALVVVQNGKQVFSYNKSILANYNEFDELRNYQAGDGFSVNYQLDSQNQQSFVYCALICEDIWNNSDGKKLINKDNLAIFDIIDAVIVINSSPYNDKKISRRESAVANFAHQTKKKVIYVNQVGGEDNLVFDGSSFVVDERGYKVFQMNSFTEELAIYDTSAKYKPVSNVDDNIADLYKACVLSIYDYVRKNGFRKVIIGASGGIDSSLVSVMAVDALGSENVKLVSMPSRFSSSSSVADAKELAYKLKANIEVLPINKYIDLFENELELKDLALENLQSRIRGLVLMSFSNKENALVLAPGNKSEIAVGYSTLYGDTVGAFAPIKDVYKTDVYKLAKWRNSKNKSKSIARDLEVSPIPQNIFVKPPSAELKLNQKDSDTLPDYETLDKMLKYFIESDEGIDKLLERGFKRQDVLSVAKMISKSEYKRSQMPAGPKLSVKSFGPDRRIPLDYFYTK
jgi:NAD+ synthase (glutamine-hydrolysing)